MTELTALSVPITADTSGLERGVNEAESSLSRLGTRARATVNRLGALGAAATAAGAALVTKLARDGLQAADAQAKMARSVDASIDGLRALQIAAEDAGLSQEAAASAAQMLNARLAEAARTGAGPAADSLDRLGLSAQDLMQMDVDERMAVIADRMREMGFSAADAQDELRQLGIRNREMALLMIQGGDALRDARQEVDDFGLSLSEVDAATIERANDAMSRIGRTFDVIRQQLAVQLAPILEHVAGLINDKARESGGFRDQITDAIETGVRWAARFADVLEGIRRAFLVTGQAGATGFLMIAREVNRVALLITEGPVRAVNALIDQLNRIRGVSIEAVEMPDIAGRFRESMELADAAVQEGKLAIQETLLEPFPSDAILERLELIREKSREMSEEQVEAERERRERLQEIDLEELEQVREHNEELEHEEREHMNRMASLRESGMSALANITGRSFRQQNQTVSQQLGEMLQTMSTQNKAMFEVSKAFAIADAVVNAYQGITRTLAAYPWPIAGAMAAAHGAFAFAQVSAIRSQSFGGGGGSAPAGGAGGGGMASTASAAAPQQAQGQGASRMLTVSGINPGELFSGDAVRQLAEELLEFQRDGGRVVFAD